MKMHQDIVAAQAGPLLQERCMLGDPMKAQQVCNIEALTSLQPHVLTSLSTSQQDLQQEELEMQAAMLGQLT